MPDGRVMATTISNADRQNEAVSIDLLAFCKCRHSTILHGEEKSGKNKSFSLVRRELSD